MKPWNVVQKEILHKVFANENSESILSASDLSGEGFLKSLSIVSILSVLQEENEGFDYMAAAEAEDFLNMSTIQALYEKGCV